MVSQNGQQALYVQANRLDFMSVCMLNKQAKC